ncbi:MAG: hypothetical protein EYC62_07175 [Alphaproteobacteria bacterium]|nr:MAG: hypothetical protein EYC62_07175 [Alphaproteobacteria bacterium]
MKKIFIIGVLVWLVFPAWAAELTLTTDDCEYFVPHTPDDDVAFKPGLDINGDSVTPADLNDNAIELPQKISIPIILQLETQTQNDPPGSVKIGQLENQAGLGTLTYDTKTRQLFYRDKLVSDSSRQAVIDACKDLDEKRENKSRHASPPAVEK